MPINEINTTIACSRETKILIDRLMAQETKRTGYKIKSMDIINRAIRDLANELKVTSPVAIVKSAKKLVKKAKRVSKNYGKKWTPAQRAKFKQTVANKKKSMIQEEVPEVKLSDFIPSHGLENQ